MNADFLLPDKGQVIYTLLNKLAHTVGDNSYPKESQLIRNCSVLPKCQKSPHFI